MDTTQTLSQRALSIACQRGIARAQDFRAAWIPPAYLTRLCQLADPEHMEAGHSLAEAARLAPHEVSLEPARVQLPLHALQDIDLFVQQSRLHASESNYTAGDGFSDDLLVEPARA